VKEKLSELFVWSFLIAFAAVIVYCVVLQWKFIAVIIVASVIPFFLLLFHLWSKTCKAGVICMIIWQVLVLIMLMGAIIRGTESISYSLSRFENSIGFDIDYDDNAVSFGMVSALFFICNYIWCGYILAQPGESNEYRKPFIVRHREEMNMHIDNEVVANQSKFRCRICTMPSNDNSMTCPCGSTQWSPNQ